MNWIDAILIAGLALFALIGWKLRGLLVLAVLCALVASPLLGRMASAQWGPWMHRHTQSWIWGEALVYWFAFVVVALLVWFAFQFLAGLAEGIGLAWLDGLAGALLLAAFGLLLLTPGHRALEARNPGWRTMAKGSCLSCRQIFPCAEAQTPRLLSLLKNDLASNLGPAPEKTAAKSPSRI